MDCNVLSRYSDLYLDGELALEERTEVEAHLKQCSECRDAVTAEVRFRQRVRESLLAARAPTSLREQVARRIREERGRLDRPRFFPTLSYAVAVLMLAVMGYAVFFLMESPPDAADSAVAAHMASSDSEMFGTSAQVQAFLEGNAPFRYQVPLEDREGVKLVGARVTRLGPRPAVVYLYDVAGRRVSVAQYQSAPARGRPRLKMDRRSGLVVATYGDDRLTQTVVGDLPEPEVKRFIPASFSQ